MKDWVKRIVPFVLTLALGMFIASFFVTLTMPRMRYERRHEYKRHIRQQNEKLRMENEKLRRDMERLREELRYQEEAFRVERPVLHDAPLVYPPLPPAPPRVVERR